MRPGQNLRYHRQPGHLLRGGLVRERQCLWLDQRWLLCHTDRDDRHRVQLQRKPWGPPLLVEEPRPDRLHGQELDQHTLPGCERCR